jgi:hypothetical protein
MSGTDACAWTVSESLAILREAAEAVGVRYSLLASLKQAGAVFDCSAAIPACRVALEHEELAKKLPWPTPASVTVRTDVEVINSLLLKPVENTTGVLLLARAFSALGPAENKRFAART